MNLAAGNLASSLANLGKGVLLWNCTPDQNWARDFESILSNDLKLKLSIQQVEDYSECYQGKLLKDSAVLVLTATASQQPTTLDALKELRNNCFELPILAITDVQDQAVLMRWIEEGISDFIGVPMRSWEILARMKHWLVVQPSEVSVTGDELTMRTNLAGIIGRSEALCKQVEKVRRYAVCNSAVLILGETGTGKEVFARAIHYASPRSSYPFVPVNCAALPVELIENELFGHESGAYTGAQRVHKGLIEQAEKGTLFLDEIDSLPLPAQAKLLRFLQEREYRPLGAARSRRADVRVLSASNSNLEAAVKASQFREDLYFRLNVLALSLPPLRKRREDIPLLAEHLATRHASSNALPKAFTRGALNKLSSHSWPGNVRELENVIERAIALAAGNVIEESDIEIPDAVPSPENDSFKAQKTRAIYEFEHHFLQDILARHGGNISQAAKTAAKNRRAFFHLLKKHNLTRRYQQSCQTSSLPLQASI